MLRFTIFRLTAYNLARIIKSYPVYNLPVTLYIQNLLSTYIFFTFSHICDISYLKDDLFRLIQEVFTKHFDMVY